MTIGVRPQISLDSNQSRFEDDPDQDVSTDDEQGNADEDGMEFTKAMQISTRKAHRMTDLLVNAKLGFAMSDDRVWAEGLLIFYEIFRFLEAALTRLRNNVEVFNRMAKVLDGIYRTTAFEQDLSAYYGESFLINYEIRPSVGNYLRHLQVLEDREPLRLLAYIYHLYLGLLSGGQILKKKRDLKNKITTVGGLIGNTIPENQIRKDHVTLFEDGRSIADIKKEIKFTMNDIACDLSADERNSLLEEGVKVFRYNLEVIQSIKGTGRIAAMNVVKHPIFIFSILLLLYVIYSLYN